MAAWIRRAVTRLVNRAKKKRKNSRAFKKNLLACTNRVTGVGDNSMVSTIRFLGRDRFLGLCLSREEPRQFYLQRCQNVRLAPAAEFLMPVAMAG